LEYPVLSGWIILEWFLKKWEGGINWIDLFQGRDRWQTLVNTVMNLRTA
jgi:hypothetical protein